MSESGRSRNKSGRNRDSPPLPCGKSRPFPRGRGGCFNEDLAAGEVRRRVGESMILGVSVHTVEEARQAVQDGADYLGLGAVFPTGTKTDVDVMSRDTLQAICGAGIQADLKTMTMNGVFAMSAVTALVAQNTTGVKSIVEVQPDFLAEQLDSVFTDIFPDAVKIGMVASCGLIETIAERLKFYQAKNIVVDPVMVATSGDRLVSEEAVDTLKTGLLPLAAVATPNIPEAEILSGMTIRSEADIEAAARGIGDAYGCAILLKGGHNVNDANDFLYVNGVGTWFCGTRIDNPNTHGTGCTLSSAIAANLAKGFDLPTSIQRSMDYLSGALGAMLDLGKGRGPMQHNFNLTGEFAKEAEQ